MPGTGNWCEVPYRPGFTPGCPLAARQPPLSSLGYWEAEGGACVKEHGRLTPCELPDAVAIPSRHVLFVMPPGNDFVQPHRWQPTKLPCPWDSPGRNTGVGCHFLLQCIKVKSESESEVVSNPQQPHGLQPTRLLLPWDFPGKSTGVGCCGLLLFKCT